MKFTKFCFYVQMPGASTRIYQFKQALDYDSDGETAKLIGQWEEAFNGFNVTAHKTEQGTIIDIVLTNNDIYDLYTRTEPIVKLLEKIYKHGEAPRVNVTNLSKEFSDDDVNLSMHISILTTKIEPSEAIFHFVDFIGGSYKSGCHGEQRALALKSVNTFISGLQSFNTF